MPMSDAHQAARLRDAILDTAWPADADVFTAWRCMQNLAHRLTVMFAD
jgi:hypothetical protein